jgi:hypothetical protein
MPDGSGVPAAGAELTAIDVLLEPDATMVAHAEQVNARLLENHPRGFALDATHAPHITLLQCYIQTADLERVSAAVAAVLASKVVAGLPLRAIGYDYIQASPFDLASIVIEPGAELLRLQRRVIDAVGPYLARGGTADAFVDRPRSGTIDATIAHVEQYVPEHSGEHFHPHVTVGVGREDFIQRLLAEPFDAFTFGIAGAAIYHLGDLGTARAKLWGTASNG